MSQELTDLEQAFEELKRVEYLMKINSSFLAKCHLQNAIKIINNKIGEEIEQSTSSVTAR